MVGSVRLLVVQPTPFCNLDCDYCYLPDRGDRSRLSFPVLEAAVERVLDSPYFGGGIHPALACGRTADGANRLLRRGHRADSAAPGAARFAPLQDRAVAADKRHRHRRVMGPLRR